MRVEYNMKSRAWVSTFCRVLLILAVFVGAIAVNQYKMPRRHEGASKYTTADVTYADGSTAHFDDIHFGTVSKGDTVTLHIALPETAPMPRGTLVFYDYSTVTQVWYGDTLLDSYGEESAAAGRLIGNHVFFVDIPDAAWGDELTIILRPTENHAFTDFTQMKIFPAKTALLWFTDNMIISFSITIALFVFVVFGAFACLLGGIRGAALKNGSCLVLVALFVSLWSFSNGMIYTLFRLNFYLWEPLEYIAGFSIAIPVLFFFSGMESKNILWKKILKWAAVAIAAFVAGSTVLNFTNILHYSVLMNMFSVLLVACSLLLLVYSIQLRRDKSKTKRMLRAGSYIFVLTCVYEVLIRVIGTYISAYPSLITLGLFFFMLYMTGAFISDMYSAQKDLLTVQIKAGMLDHVIDTTPAGLCQLVPNGKIEIISANNAFYKIMGYRDNELSTGKPTDAFTHLLDAEQLYLHQKLDEIMQAPANEGEFEFTTVDIDNDPLTILIRYYYDRDGSGNVTVNLLDITDRKRTEENLRLSEERYKLALNQSGKVFFFFDVQAKTMRLSKELADAFGLPLEVDNMPDNFISSGLVEPESEDAYRHFYERIYAGEKQGDTIISCHMRNTPELVLWYRIAFTTVFDDGGHPSSSIITYEDISKQHQMELQSKWKQLNLASLKETDYVIAVYDLTQNKLISQTGGLFTKMPAFISSFDEINAFVIENFFHEDDREPYTKFIDRERLIEMFRSGKTEDAIEYRSLQNGSTFRWTSATVSLIEDSFNRHIMAQIIFRDIDALKTGEVQMRQSVEMLKQELDNSRIKVMINQMQPHFLYNALSSIQILIKRDPDRAYKLIRDFTVHLRGNIKALSSDEPIPFTEELKNVKAYLNIEQMRLSDNLHVNYEIGCEDFGITPLTIQPLVENAVKHGVFPRGEDGGIITLRTYENADHYIIEVKDDGIGFDVGQALEENNNSYGLKNLVFRLKSLMNAEVTFKSEIGSGTLVRVLIPKTEKGGGDKFESDRSRR